MSKQIIISVSREFGSGGHVIAQNIAKQLDIPVYDYNILKEIAVQKGVDHKNLEKYDEIPKSRLFSRTVRGYNNSPEENIANLQFRFLKDLAAKGESFVVVGRCSESILSEYEGLSSFFILADMDKKIRRTADYYHISDEEAEEMVFSINRKRKQYHNYYCNGSWGDSRYYDMSINCSPLGLDGTTEIVSSFIQKKYNL